MNPRESDGSSPAAQSETWKSKTRTVDKSFSYFARNRERGRKKKKRETSSSFTFVMDKADIFFNESAIRTRHVFVKNIFGCSKVKIDGGGGFDHVTDAINLSASFR